MKTMTVDGNEACSYSAYMFTELAGIYPITPASPMAEHIDEWSNNNRLNIFNDKVKVIEMQSEAGAAGLVHGSLSAGVLTTTFTASQGLLLMIPNMYKIAGEMLPCVMHVAARSLATHALSIFGDHQDIYATRMTGFNMLASSNPEDAAFLSIVAHLSAIKASLPFLHFFDGFRTSHEIDKINVLEEDDIKDLIDYEALNNFRKRALNPLNPFIKGTTQNDDIYFQATEARNKFYQAVPDIVNDYMEKLNKKAKTDYKPFNYYGSKTATKVIVAMGSVCETIKEVIDTIGGEIGLIEVHLYRPFSQKYFKQILPNTVKNIAVLDRTKEFNLVGEPLYLDVVSILKDEPINIVGGRYGLSSKNTKPALIKAVYDMLDNPKNNFTIGIEDDVTNLSLDIPDFKINKHDEMLIYGYGSDGMISASKSMIKLVGDNTDKFVQGYFEYDSKKSGGVTISHLRFSNEKIRSAYYVENPKLIAITKDTYLDEFDTLSKIKPNGTVIINTIKSKEEFILTLSDKNKAIIKDRNINLYIINAYSLARKLGLGNKISMIMESVIIKLLDLIDYEFAKEQLKKYIKTKFMKKGEDVITANQESIDLAVKYIEKVNIDSYNEYQEEKVTTIYEMLKKRLGNELKVSAFMSKPDGRFNGGTSAYEKRCISDTVPVWLSDNCIQCNQCSFVCPHAVIRPFLLDQEEYDNASEVIKSRCVKPLNKEYENYYYTVAISVSDCTGCGLCIKTCPGKKTEKALIPDLLEKQKLEQKIFDYLNDNIKEKDTNTDLVAGSQFKKPKFEFCGACAGCGETSYIKILTQLFGKQLVIANATGCSSIYGGSMPSMPYTIPWANSLFEDNAEFSYGILNGNNVMRNRIRKIMSDNMDNPNSDLFKKWLDNMDDYNTTLNVYQNIDYDKAPKVLSDLKDYIVKKSVWAIGGDGWAYDIGFSGIDHVLSSNDDVNILVLDSQVYSNTGGQSSKASPRGAIASFASSGKKTSKKDLARICLSYPNCYVATICLGANMMQTIKALKEAEAHKGPSIVIAYTPCISHGIDGGLVNSIEMEKLATLSGYYPIFRYNPDLKKFTLDSKKVDFDKYEEFLLKQTRYKMLKKINPDEADTLLKQNKEDAINRFSYYQDLAEKTS